MSRPIPGGRCRQRIGIAFFLAGAGWAVLMVVSAWWWFGYSTRTWLADIGDGTLYTRSIDPGGWSRPLPGWCGGCNVRWVQGVEQPWMWTWWTWGERKANWDKGHAFTVWPLAPIFMVAGAGLYWPGLVAAQRLRRNQCPGCGYSREGLGAACACPECGMRSE